MEKLDLIDFGVNTSTTPARSKFQA